MDDRKKTTPMKAVSIVSLNCFLIPYFLTFRNLESARSRMNQLERAQRIASFVSKKDIVVLQEVWGSQVGTLQDGVAKTHSILPGFESKAVYGYLGNFFDSVSYWWYQTGGLWACYKKDMPLTHNAKHTFSVSETYSQKGVQAFLLDMKSYWPDRYLLIVNTHLDPRHVENKRQQFKEIHSFIGEVIKQIKTSPLYTNTFFQNCGVMVMGDFNTDSRSSEYQRMISTLQARDLYKEHITRTGATEQATFDGANNSLVLCEDEIRRIDYIFALDSYSYTDASKDNQVKFMKLAADQFKIETQTKGEELSDHWALSVDVKPQQ